MKEIRDAIRGLAFEATATFEIAVVTAVNREQRTVDVVFDGVEIVNVRLSVIISNEQQTHVISFPKIGSDVLVIEIEQGVWMCAMVSEIEEVEVVIGTTKLNLKNGEVSISADSIVFNGGNNKGLVNVEPLKEQLTAITDWMKKVDFVLKNTQVLSTAPGTPDPLQIALKAALTTTKIPQIKGLENENITH